MGPIRLACRVEHLLLLLVAAHASAELIGVQVVHRHGDRPPINIVPKFQKDWDERNLIQGELTQIGVAQHAVFGSFLRAKYIDNEKFLPPTYSPKNLYVRSTDVNRCLSSAKSNLAMLYPGAFVPVHTVPTPQDKLLQPSDKCPAYVASVIDHNAEFSRRAVEQFGQEFLDQLAEELGVTDSTPASLLDRGYDNLVCMLAHNMTLSPFLLNNLEAIRNFTKWYYYAKFAMVNEEDPRGPTGGELSRTMANNFVERTTPFILYSAHDSTVTSLFTGLGLLTRDNVDVVLPPYAASIILELRKIDDKLMVSAQYGYVKATGVDPNTPQGWEYVQEDLQLKCPELQDSCPLDAFVSYIKKLGPEFGTDNYCCTRVPAFETHGCHAFHIGYERANTTCQLYRRVCPAVACGGQLVNSVYDCVDHVTETTGHESAYRTATFALAAAFCLSVVVGALIHKKYKKVYSAMTTDFPE